MAIGHKVRWVDHPARAVHLDVIRETHTPEVIFPSIMPHNNANFAAKDSTLGVEHTITKCVLDVDGGHHPVAQVNKTNALPKLHRHTHTLCTPRWLMSNASVLTQLCRLTYLLGVPETSKRVESESARVDANGGHHSVAQVTRRACDEQGIESEVERVGSKRFACA